MRVEILSQRLEDRDVTTTARTVVPARGRIAGRDIERIPLVPLVRRTEAATGRRGLLVDTEARAMRRRGGMCLLGVEWTRVATRAPTTVVPEAVRTLPTRLRASI